MQQRVGGREIGCSGAERGVAEDRGDFRAEHQCAARGAIVKRLFAETIAREMKRAGGAVAPGEREHAVDQSEGFAHAMQAQQLEQHFGVGAVAQRNAGGAQLFGERGKAVYLAIEYEGVAGNRIDAWLRAAGEINDGKPGMGECEGGIRVVGGGIRAAVREGCQHGAERFRRRKRPAK